MLTKTVSCNAGQVSDLIQLNIQRWLPPGASLIVNAISVTGTYKLEVSNDPPAEPQALDDLQIIPSTHPRAPTNWADHDEITGKSADSVSNIAYPVQWVRLNCASVSAGTVVLGAAQTMKALP